MPAAPCSRRSTSSTRRPMSSPTPASGGSPTAPASGPSLGGGPQCRCRSRSNSNSNSNSKRLSATPSHRSSLAACPRGLRSMSSARRGCRAGADSPDLPPPCAGTCRSDVPPLRRATWRCLGGWTDQCVGRAARRSRRSALPPAPAPASDTARESCRGTARCSGESITRVTDDVARLIRRAAEENPLASTVSTNSFNASSLSIGKTPAVRGVVHPRRNSVAGLAGRAQGAHDGRRAVEKHVHLAADHGADVRGHLEAVDPFAHAEIEDGGVQAPDHLDLGL